MRLPYFVAVIHVGNTKTYCEGSIYDPLPVQRRSESSLYPNSRTSGDIVQTDIDYGQWRIGTIPKLETFTYWKRKWEVRVSTHPHMGWGLYAMEAAKSGDELLPFVGKRFSKVEFCRRCEEDKRFLKYAIRLKKNVYQDGDVLNGNVAGFINSCIGREHIGNALW